MDDKRNPNAIRGDGETRDSYLGRVNELISRIEWQSDGHRQWYTHKNPYGCWICEILQIARQLQSFCMDERVSQGADANDLDEDVDFDDQLADPEEI